MRLRSPAFTLVEVLVVISLIVLLLAMLQPSLGKSRETARRSICASQARQQGIGMGAFANDHKQTYPTAVIHSNWPDGAMCTDWNRADSAAGQGVLFVEGYIKDPRAFYCPSNSHSASNWLDIETAWNPSDWRYTYVHYPYWANYQSVYDPGQTLRLLVARGPTDPSDRVLVTDNITIDTGSAHANSASRNHLGLANEPAGGNVLRNDNSAGWIRFEQTKQRVVVPRGAPHQRDFYF